MAFNINAHVILSGPKNIKSVTSSIQRQLGTIKARVDLQIPKGIGKSVTGFNKSITTLNTNLNTLRGSTASLNSQLSTLATHFDTLGKSSASISKSQSDIQKNLSKTGKEVNRVANEVQAFGKDAALAIRRFAAFTVATGVVFGFVRSVQTATKAAIDYEREITKVIQVTGAGASQIDQLNKSITKLSVSLGVDANELAELSRIFAQTGQTISQVQSSIKAVARSTLAPTFGEMKNTAEGLIAAMAQFNIAASRQEEVLAGLNAVSKKFAVEAEDLVSVIRRAGGVFSQASGQFRDPVDSLNELIGIFTAVRSTTRESADTISVGLRTIFTRIQRRGTIDFLKQFNIELVNAKGNFIGLFPAFQELAKGLDGIIKRGDALTLSAITEELGGVRQVGKLIPAITQFNKALAATKIAGQAAAEGLGKDVALGLQPLGKQFEQLQQRFSAFVREISQSQTFQGLAKVALSLGNAFLSVSETLKPLLPLLTTFAAIKISKGLFDFGTGFVGGLRKGGGAGGAGGALGSAVTGGGGGGGGATDPALTSAMSALTTSQNRLITATDRLMASVSTYGRSVSDQGLDLELSIINLTRGMDRLVTALNTIKLGGGGFSPFGTGPRPRKFAKGGPVHGPSHAQGGVPAILEGGEYVIPKGYAGGGKTTKKKGPSISVRAKANARQSFGAFILQQFGDSEIAPDGVDVSGSGFKKLKGKIRGKLMSSKPGKYSAAELGAVKTGSKEFKRFLMEGEGGTAKDRLLPLGTLPADATSAFGTLPTRSKNRWKKSFLTKTQRGRGVRGLDAVKNIKLQGPFPAFSIAGQGDLNTELSEEFTKVSKSVLGAGIEKLSKSKFIKKLSNELKPISVSKNKLFDFEALYQGASESVEGFLLEGVIAGLTNAKVGGGGTNFDFDGLAKNARAQSRLQKLFGDDEAIQKVKRADAKRKFSTATKGEGRLVNKIARVLKGSQFDITQYAAAGGNIFAPRGTDTVPAMLTPGEFVINKGSAKKIGYGNLGRMNRMKDGGVVPSNRVQYFADGTSTAADGGGGRDALGLMMGMQAATGAVAGFTVALSSFDMDAPVTSLMNLAFAVQQASMAMTLLAPSLTENLMRNRALSSMTGRLGGVFKKAKRQFVAPLEAFQGASRVFSRSLEKTKDSTKAFSAAGRKAKVSLMRNFGASSLKGVIGRAFTGVPALIASLIAKPLIDGITGPVTEAMFGAVETIEGTDIQGRGADRGGGGAAGAIGSLGSATAKGLGVAGLVGLINPVAGAIAGLGVAVTAVIKGFNVGKAQQAEFDAFTDFSTSLKESSKVLQQFNKANNANEESLKKLNKTLEKVINTSQLFEAGVERRTAQRSFLGKGRDSQAVMVGARQMQDQLNTRVITNAVGAFSSGAAVTAAAIMSVAGSLGFVTAGVSIAVGALAALGVAAWSFSKGSAQIEQAFDDINASFDAATRHITPEFMEQVNTAFAHSTTTIIRNAAEMDASVARSLGQIDIGNTFSSAAVRAEGLNDSLRISEDVFSGVEQSLDAATGGASKLIDEYNELSKMTLVLNLTDAMKKASEDFTKEGKADLSLAMFKIQEAMEGFSGSPEEAYRRLTQEIDQMENVSLATRLALSQATTAEIARQQVLKDVIATTILAEQAGARAARAFDAIAASFDNFAAQTGQISSQLSNFTGSMKTEFDNIFSNRVQIGSFDTVNPFTNIETATRSEIATGMQQVQSLSGTPNDPAFQGIESLVAASKEIPFALKDALGELTKGGGDVTTSEVIAQVTKSLQARGIDTSQMSPKALSGLEDAITKGMKEGASRQGGTMTDPISVLKGILGEQGDVAKNLLEMSQKAKDAMAIAFDAASAYRNALLDIAKMQQEMVQKEREFKLSMLDKEAAMRDRINRAIGNEGPTSGMERARLGARLRTHTQTRTGINAQGGAISSGVPGVADPFSVEQLMSQRRTIQDARRASRERLGLAPDEVFDPARADMQSDAKKEEANKLGLLNDQLNGNTDALKELANNTSVLAAIEKEIAALQKKAIAATQSAMSMDEARIAVASGEMDQADFDKNFGNPLRALVRASRGEAISANDAIRIRHMENDPAFAGFLDTAIESETERRRANKEMVDDGQGGRRLIQEGDVRREFHERVNRQIAAAAAASGVGSDLTPVIRQQHARGLALRDSARAKGEEMAAIGGTQVDAATQLFNSQQNEFREIFKTANNGLADVVQKFQDAVDDFRRLRGIGESPITAANRQVQAAKELKTLEDERAALPATATDEQKSKLDRQIIDAKDRVQQAENDVRSSFTTQDENKARAEARLEDAKRAEQDAKENANDIRTQQAAQRKARETLARQGVQDTVSAFDEDDDTAFKDNRSAAFKAQLEQRIKTVGDQYFGTTATGESSAQSKAFQERATGSLLNLARTDDDATVGQFGERANKLLQTSLEQVAGEDTITNKQIDAADKATEKATREVKTADKSLKDLVAKQTADQQTATQTLQTLTDAATTEGSIHVHLDKKQLKAIVEGSHEMNDAVREGLLADATFTPPATPRPASTNLPLSPLSPTQVENLEAGLPLGPSDAVLNADTRPLHMTDTLGGGPPTSNRRNAGGKSREKRGSGRRRPTKRTGMGNKNNKKESWLPKWVQDGWTETKKAGSSVISGLSLVGSGITATVASAADKGTRAVSGIANLGVDDQLFEMKEEQKAEIARLKADPSTDPRQLQLAETRLKAIYSDAIQGTNLTGVRGELGASLLDAKKSTRITERGAIDTVASGVKGAMTGQMPEDHVTGAISEAFAISGSEGGILEGISQWTTFLGEFFASGGASLTVGGAKAATKIPAIIKKLRDFFTVVAKGPSTALVKTATGAARTGAGGTASTTNAGRLGFNPSAMTELDNTLLQLGNTIDEVPLLPGPGQRLLPGMNPVAGLLTNNPATIARGAGQRLLPNFSRPSGQFVAQSAERLRQGLNRGKATTRPQPGGARLRGGLGDDISSGPLFGNQATGALDDIPLNRALVPAQPSGAIVPQIPRPMPGTSLIPDPRLPAFELPRVPPALGLPPVPGTTMPRITGGLGRVSPSKPPTSLTVPRATPKTPPVRVSPSTPKPKVRPTTSFLDELKTVVGQLKSIIKTVVPFTVLAKVKPKTGRKGKGGDLLPIGSEEVKPIGTGLGIACCDQLLEKLDIINTTLKECCIADEIKELINQNKNKEKETKTPEKEKPKPVENVDAIGVKKRQEEWEKILADDASQMSKTITLPIDPLTNPEDKKRAEEAANIGVEDMMMRNRSDKLNSVRAAAATSPDAATRRWGQSLINTGTRQRRPSPRWTSETLEMPQWEGLPPLPGTDATGGLGLAPLPSDVAMGSMYGPGGIMNDETAFDFGFGAGATGGITVGGATGAATGNAGEVLAKKEQETKAADGCCVPGEEMGALIVLGMKSNIEGIGTTIAEEIKANLAGTNIDINANVGPMQVQITDGGNALRRLGEGMVDTVKGVVTSALDAIFNSDGNPKDPGTNPTSAKNVINQIGGGRRPIDPTFQG